MRETCGGCGRARAVRATVDGSGSCKDCAWGADAATIWIARGSRLCEHAYAAKQMGLLLNTRNMRDLVLSVARKWAERESFVGNVIRWEEVMEYLVITWGLQLAAQGTARLQGDWEREPTRPGGAKQATLHTMGITGGQRTVGTGGKVYMGTESA